MKNLGTREHKYWGTKLPRNIGIQEHIVGIEEHRYFGTWVLRNVGKREHRYQEI